MSKRALQLILSSPKCRLIVSLMVALASIFAASLWALMPVFLDRPLTGCRYFLPRHLIEPIWLGHADTDLFACVTEARARMLLVGVSFLLLPAVLLCRHFTKARKDEDLPLR